MNITSNPINYSTVSYPAASTTAKDKANRYASLRIERRKQEDQKVQKQFNALRSAKKSGTLSQNFFVKRVATREECEQARFLLGLASPFNN